MNYGSIPHDTDASTHPVALDVRELTIDEAKTALQPIKTLEGGGAAFDWLFGKDAPDIDPRTILVRGKNVLVLQIGQSVTKRCGIKTRADNVDYIPVRKGRTTDWIPA